MSKVLLKIKGRKTNRFIKRLNSNDIEILSLLTVSDNVVIIKVYYSDLDTIYKLKSIYEVEIIRTYGFLWIKKFLKINKHLIIASIVGFMIFIFLTNIIFDIEVVHSNKDLRNLVKEELTNNGITKYSFKKSYDEINGIKEKIVKAHKDRIEWLEIENVGVKYIVRLEEREIIKNNDSNHPRSLVAKKDAIIKKVIADKGDIVKDENTYVKKGDVIVNGEIMLNDNSMGKVRALGKVYGEVWYVVKTSYPFVYYEETDTGRKHNIYKIKFLNKNFEFTLHKFKHKKNNEKVILKHNLLPLSFIYDRQRELKIKSQVLTFDEALIKAQALAISKINKNLSKDEYIIRFKHLKSSVNNSTIDIEMFFAIYEDITDYKEIE